LGGRWCEFVAAIDGTAEVAPAAAISGGEAEDGADEEIEVVTERGEDVGALKGGTEALGDVVACVGAAADEPGEDEERAGKVRGDVFEEGLVVEEGGVDLLDPEALAEKAGEATTGGDGGGGPTAAMGDDDDLGLLMGSTGESAEGIGGAGDGGLDHFADAADGRGELEGAGGGAGVFSNFGRELGVDEPAATGHDGDEGDVGLGNGAEHFGEAGRAHVECRANGESG
jgi:hypothetical protein